MIYAPFYSDSVYPPLPFLHVKLHESDRSLAQISGSGGNTEGRLFYTVEARCNQFIPCSDKEVTCVVCTK